MRRSGSTVAALVGTALLLVVGAASVCVGASGIPLDRVAAALIGSGGVGDRALVLDVRLPRVALAALVGLNLAVSGLLAQTLTRNPLASAQTFGVNAGAALAVVVTTVAVGASAASGTAAALGGALVVGVLMWALSAGGRLSAVGLALAGMSLQILLAAVVQAVLIAENATEDVVFWLAGSVTGAQWSDVALLAPFAAVGVLATVLARRRLALLALDPQTGRALGVRPERTGALAAALVTVLAGSSVAVAGPIGFVGLIVPHLARRFAGGGFGPVLALSIVGGPLLLTLADLVARLVAFPTETPAGIITAAVGAPVFLLLVLRKGAA